MKDMQEKKKRTGKARRETTQATGVAGLPVPAGSLLLSESDIMEHLLDVSDPQAIVRGLSRQDYYWLVKNASDEWFALIALASERQWQYLLDLELWDRDLIDTERLELWMERYAEADPDRFAEWLLSEGLSLAYTWLDRVVDVLGIDPDDEDQVIPEGFFSLDGVFYVRPRNEDSYPVVRSILEAMAGADRDRYEWVLTTLGGIVPAEMEEEMFRFRNARLADDGFLPFDEAMAIYSPLDPSAISDQASRGGTVALPDEDEPGIPRLPLARAAVGELLGRALESLSSDPVLDRIALEFAGLANRIIAADGLAGRELDHMATAAEKAGKYVNLALEHCAGEDVDAAAALLMSNPAPTLFQVGFGLVAQVAVEAESLVRRSWFRSAGIRSSFWGDPAGKVLAGLLARRPRLYRTTAGTGAYGEFEKTGDLSASWTMLERIATLDDFFALLDRKWPLDRNLASCADMTFDTLLITLYGRLVTGGEPGFGGLSLADGKAFLELAREGERNPPYAMDPMGRLFVSDLMALSPETADSPRGRILADLLAALWRDFQDEYEQVEAADLSPRYSRLLYIIDGEAEL